jgi:peptide/nickel transport system substrate-binding protein
MQPLPMNELVKAQLEAVGFRVKLEVMDWNSMLDVYIRGSEKFPQYDGINFSSGSPDPINFVKTIMTMFRAPNGANWGWYQNAEVNRLGEQVLASFDDGERDKLTAQMHEAAVRDAARLFIVSDLNPRALSPRLKGFVQARSWFQDVTPIVVGGAGN